ncbi:MAG: hypothetical protein H7061_00530 [Bdellovibrionaceae bacterium]|nr:hypothetical protein [Bdellovibrio sp.]
MSSTLRTLSLVTVFLLFSLNLRAEILFEGYYKASQFKKHIGFLILRHELNAKTKQFKTTSFMRLGKNGFDMTESYQAVSDAGKDLAPIKLSYLAVEGKNTTKTIDVTFKNQKMTGTAVENKKTTKISEQLPKDAFLSSALYYLLLKSKEGLKTDSNRDFKAITEEGPALMDGRIMIDKKMVTQGSLQLLKIKTNFAGPEYENLVTTRGEVISAVTPSTSIETHLVSSPNEALEGIKVAAGTLEKIFGDVPAGKINVYHSK